MHALGNVKISQGSVEDPPDIVALEAGFDWHQKAYKHYMKTIGEDHHRTADVSYRLADDYMILTQHGAADAKLNHDCAGSVLFLCHHLYTAHLDSVFLERSLKVFNSKTCFLPEKMRTLNLKGILNDRLGRKDDAERHFEQVRELYNLSKAESEPVGSGVKVAQAKLDKLVTFWSR